MKAALAALCLLLARGAPAAALAVDHYSLVINPSLSAIPMFTLAGYLLAESRAPARLIEVFDALFGRMRGARRSSPCSHARSSPASPGPRE